MIEAAHGENIVGVLFIVGIVFATGVRHGPILP